jgi:peptidoglycan/LPS O-acetylase OafA/YrhL
MGQGAPLQENQQVASSKGSAGYIPSLDGLRAISIAMVFLGHADVSKLIPAGFGVTVFFFLSGYLITTLLVREHEAHGSIALKAFYLRRALRLGPPLLVTLAFGALLVLVGLAGGDLAPDVFLSQIFFFYNYYSLVVDDSSVRGFAVLWSLSVEEHFYLVYPLLFIAFARGRLGVRGIFVLCLAVLAWRCVRVFALGSSELAITQSTDTRFDSMLFGCLLALVEARGLARKWLPDRTLYLTLGAGLALLAATFLVREEEFRLTLRYTLQGIALMPIFYFAVNRADLWFFRPLNWKPVRRIGQYSYTLYLVHYVIIAALTRNGMDMGNSLVFVPVAAVLCLLYAALVHEFAEKPFKPLRERLTGHPLQPAHGPAFALASARAADGAHGRDREG